MSVIDGTKEPIVDECRGCSYASNVCQLYLEPEWHWRNGQTCQAATHIKRELTLEQKKRVGQQHHLKKMKVSRKQQEAYSRIGVD